MFCTVVFPPWCCDANIYSVKIYVKLCVLHVTVFYFQYFVRHKFEKSNFPRILFRHLRFRTWCLEIKHLKAHNSAWQGCFSFIIILQLRPPIELNFSQVCYCMHMLRYTKEQDWSLRNMWIDFTKIIFVSMSRFNLGVYWYATLLKTLLCGFHTFSPKRDDQWSWNFFVLFN